MRLLYNDQPLRQEPQKTGFLQPVLRLLFVIIAVILCAIPLSCTETQPPKPKDPVRIELPILQPPEAPSELPIPTREEPPVRTEIPAIQKVVEPLIRKILQQPAKPDVKLYTPDSSVHFAAVDLAGIPDEDKHNMRYLSLYNIQPEFRKEVAQIVSFVANSLGTRKKPYIPVFVGNSDETVIRLNIDDYEWTSSAWEELGKIGSGKKPQPEPYFHAFVDKFLPVTTKKITTKNVTKKKQVQIRYSNGSVGTKEEPYTEAVAVEEDVEGGVTHKRLFASAPWIDKNAITYLLANTKSETPIMRADWFVCNATLPPAYYNFLRLGKTTKDFGNLIFADEEKAKLARSQDKGVVISSIVARNNRTLTRSPTFTGGYVWISHDSLTSVDDRQYINNVLSEKFDATEDIGSLPNGLQAYFLTDGKGNRIDFADSDIAVDNTAADRIVRTGRSCIICHAEGIRPIDDAVRTLTKKLQNQEQIKLLITKKEDLYKIEDLFGSDLDEQIIKDQNHYAAAMGRVNGLTPAENAKIYSKIYDDYMETLLTKEVVAREVGLPMMELERIIRLSKDSIVLGLTKSPILPLRRDQWERSYQELMLLIGQNRNGGK